MPKLHGNSETGGFPETILLTLIKFCVSEIKQVENMTKYSSQF